MGLVSGLVLPFEPVEARHFQPWARLHIGCDHPPILIQNISQVADSLLLRCQRSSQRFVIQVRADIKLFTPDPQGSVIFKRQGPVDQIQVF